MDKITFKTGNIVDEITEGLIVSGNPFLNMSGGVNGELLIRGGAEMQKQLHQYLASHGIKHVKPGFALRIGPCNFHFKTIVYTVAIDGFYDSSIDIVVRALNNALNILRQDNCSTIAIPALATGYGSLSKKDFGKALRICLSDNQSFEEIIIVARNNFDLNDIITGYENDNHGFEE